MIVQRRADQLQAGDILPASATTGKPRRVITTVTAVANGMAGPNIMAHTVELSPPPGFRAPHPPDSWYPLHIVDVEAPDLTPAQAHAEELVTLARRIAGPDKIAVGIVDEARTLINKIDPPVPPTLDEVLQALTDVREEVDMPSESTRQADAILDRARRTGLLK